MSDKTTAEAIIARIVGDNMSAGERAYREHEAAAREVIVALVAAGYRIVKDQTP